MDHVDREEEKKEKNSGKKLGNFEDLLKKLPYYVRLAIIDMIHIKMTIYFANPQSTFALSGLNCSWKYHHDILPKGAYPNEMSAFSHEMHEIGMNKKRSLGKFSADVFGYFTTDHMRKIFLVFRNFQAYPHFDRKQSPSLKVIREGLVYHLPKKRINFLSVNLEGLNITGIPTPKVLPNETKLEKEKEKPDDSPISVKMLEFYGHSVGHAGFDFPVSVYNSKKITIISSVMDIFNKNELEQINLSVEMESVMNDGQLDHDCGITSLLKDVLCSFPNMNTIRELPNFSKTALGVNHKQLLGKIRNLSLLRGRNGECFNFMNNCEFPNISSVEISCEERGMSNSDLLGMATVFPRLKKLALIRPFELSLEEWKTLFLSLKYLKTLMFCLTNIKSSEFNKQETKFHENLRVLKFWKVSEEWDTEFLDKRGVKLTSVDFSLLEIFKNISSLVLGTNSYDSVVIDLDCGKLISSQLELFGTSSKLFGTSSERDQLRTKMFENLRIVKIDWPVEHEAHLLKNLAESYGPIMEELEFCVRKHESFLIFDEEERIRFRALKRLKLYYFFEECETIDFHDYNKGKDDEGKLDRFLRLREKRMTKSLELLMRLKKLRSLVLCFVGKDEFSTDDNEHISLLSTEMRNRLEIKRIYAKFILEHFKSESEKKQNLDEFRVWKWESQKGVSFQAKLMFLYVRGTKSSFEHLKFNTTEDVKK